MVLNFDQLSYSYSCSSLILLSLSFHISPLLSLPLSLLFPSISPSPFPPYLRHKENTSQAKLLYKYWSPKFNKHIISIVGLNTLIFIGKNKHFLNFNTIHVTYINRSGFSTLLGVYNSHHLIIHYLVP